MLISDVFISADENQSLRGVFQKVKEKWLKVGYVISYKNNIKKFKPVVPTVISNLLPTTIRNISDAEVLMMKKLKLRS